MKRVLFALVLAAAACSLNPQPFPPDNPDAALGSGDAGNKGNDASTFGDGAGNVPDAAEDSAPVPESDGGDAGSSDALLDVIVDAPGDAIEDVVLDVATD